MDTKTRITKESPLSPFNTHFLVDSHERNRLKIEILIVYNGESKISHLQELGKRCLREAKIHFRLYLPAEHVPTCISVFLGALRYLDSQNSSIGASTGCTTIR